MSNYWDSLGTRKTRNSQAANDPVVNMSQLPAPSVQTTGPDEDTSLPTSTPVPSPRGSRPGSAMNNMTVADFDVNNTPFGQGVNHQLQSPEDSDVLNTENIYDDEQFDKLIEEQENAIKKFRTEFVEVENWQYKLERTSCKLLTKIDKLVNFALMNNRTYQRGKLYGLRRELRDATDEYREAAKRLREENQYLAISPSVLNPTGNAVLLDQTATPRPPMGISPLASGNNPRDVERHKSPGNSGIENPATEGATATSNNLETQLKKMQEKVHRLETSNASTVQDIQKKIQDLTHQANNSISKSEMDTILQRICQLELANQNFTTNKLPNIETNAKRAEDNINVLRNLCDGQGEDLASILRRLSALESISELTAMGQSFHRRTNSAAQPASNPNNNSVSFNIPTSTSSAGTNLISETTNTGTTITSTENQQTSSGTQPGENNTTPSTQTTSSPPAPTSNLAPAPGRSSQVQSDQTGDRLNRSTDSLTEDRNYADIVKQRLTEGGRNLIALLQPEIDSSLSKNRIASLHKSTLNLVCSERRDLEKLMDKYERFPAHQLDTSALIRAGDILTEARNWCTQLINKYDELDCANKPVDSKLFDGLGVFTETSETSIYEFLKKFDTFMEDMGSKTDRAALLYEQHLDENIKLLTVDLRADLDRLKEWLIKRFGEPRSMCENILKQLKSSSPPSDVSVTSSLLLHYRNLNAAVKRIEELHGLPGIPIDKLTNHVEGADFLNSLVKLLPAQAHKDFFEQLYKEDIDTTNIQGSRVWSVVTRIITRHSRMIEGRALSCGISASSKPKQPEKSDKKSKSANSATLSQDGLQVHHTEQSNNDENKSKASSNSSSKKSDKDSANKNQKVDLKFPCPIPGHKHELGECKSFFSARHKKRMVLAEGKCCFTCLKPFRNCKPKCKTKVPDALICKGCVPEAAKIDKTPLNVILCPRAEHKEDIDETEVQNSLEKYLAGFKPSILGKGKAAVNHILMSSYATYNCPNCIKGNCTCKPETKTRKPHPDEDTPRIDTSTGEKIIVDQGKIIEESTNDAFYVMQILNLSGQDVLTFYDRGANHNMIRGDIAEDIDLKVVTDQPINIGVVGGGKVWTSYGTYALSLGPTPDGYFHNITAQGIDKITQKFPRYSLTEINSEVRSIETFRKETLPKYIGGQDTGLLIGVKDTGLEPTLIFQLPCGLGIYQSPLMDKFGARICYGGPHKIFSEANQKAGGFNHISIHFTQMINEYRNSLYPALSRAIEPDLEEILDGVLMPRDSPPCIKIDDCGSRSLYANAVDETDMQEMGIPIDSTNDNLDEDCTCGNFHSFTMTERYVDSICIHKAKIPLSKQKEYFDQDDVEQTHSVRCEDCAKCKKCGQSAKSRMISLQEKIEQEAIEASVKIDINEKKAWVDLPFLKDPISNLKAKHNDQDSNFNQAIRVYKQQCKKPEHMRKELNKVHADLVNKGFMVKIDDLPEKHQNIIKESGFKHIMPWRIAEKPDSLSTPYRMVVDGTMTGLNQLLAKGENRMTKISDIMLRNRCRRKIWSSDVSKLYNQLHLLPSAMPFCLFLFKEDLKVEDEPDVYVMTRAWYGISPVGNQAYEALGKVTSILADTHPEAQRIVSSDLYVDDVLTGADTDEEVESQILELTDALSQGGFSLKYVVRSGHKPCSEASNDGESLKILGYKWKPENDDLYPGFGELNFNKKRRGAKKPNEFPVASPEDVVKVLKGVKISRRTVVSKMAELWDPIGLWEPYKLQLKLDSIPLKGLDWDYELPEDLQSTWTNRFKEMLQIPSFTTPRCVVPTDAVDPTKLRLICLADAAEEAGGCCIYAGFQKSDGSFSCSLLLSRSKLLNQKVPRNELEAIRIMAETTTTVKEALADLVDETIYVTDSTIALCWCNNLQKKLKVYTLFRVAEIRRNILGEVITAEDVKMPLYHIDGTLNPADLVTKRHEITPEKIGPGSVWQNGEHWMSLPTDQMPLTTYDDLKLSKAEEAEIQVECFPNVILSKSINAVLTANTDDTSTQDVTQGNTAIHHCQGCPQQQILTPLDKCYGTQDDLDHCSDCKCEVTFSSFSLKRAGDTHMLVDLIKYGWKRSLAILTNVQKFVLKLKHKVHASKNTTPDDCKLCQTTSWATPDDKIFQDEALDYIYRKETSRIIAMSSKKSLEKYHMEDGILYYQSRLKAEIKTENLDCDVFFDKHEIKEFLPIVSSDSDVFFSYLMHVHHNIRPHSGVEITMKEISKSMMVINNPRKLIQSIRKDCQTCRIINKKTLELRMLNHPDARTIMAPPFYIAQMDTVFGFRAQVFKDARKTVKVYALIICCLLTGATNVLVIEGLETTDVLQAIERHAFRHGMPSTIYVDNGTNLIALQHATFSLRDLNCQLADSYGIQVKVSNAKSHEERGRVEARVKILRSMLEKLQIKTDSVLSILQWETLFARISNMINDLPIAKCTTSNINDLGWEIITPNRLQLGRNNMRSLEGLITLNKTMGSENLLRKNRAIMLNWYQIFVNRIHHLIPRPNKWNKTDSFQIDDICLFMYNEAPGVGKDCWKLGRITEIPKNNKVVISFPAATTKKGLPKLKNITRCPRDISVIHAADDVDINTREYLERLLREK